MSHLKPQSRPVDTIELTLLSDPPSLLNTVAAGNAIRIPTMALNIFYVYADAIEKLIRELKDKCRGVIIGRRNEGMAVGDKLQHREFTYQTPRGDVKLTVQERIAWKPNPEKLEALLRQKNLWELAQTTRLDIAKVEALCAAEMITPEEMAAISDEPKPTYALIAKFEPGTPDSTP